MKKVVSSLIIGGLSISGDCFATDNNFDNGSNQNGRVAFREIKSDSAWSKVKGNTKKVLGKKIFQVATIGTATVVGAAAGTAVTAYYCAPNFAEFVNSSAKIIATYTSNALKVVANYIDPTPASTPPKVNYINPAPTFTPSRWDKTVRVVEGFEDVLEISAASMTLYGLFELLFRYLRLFKL